ncbi:MAG: transcriptional regulator [Candidatus Bathyarchaeota archaeon B23]|nr:MAG: transcriptional regulator [Candidatus Bathyarchaeota archaeon B23]
MDFPCEDVSRRILPVFRAMMARKLVGDYGFTQTEAASILGVSQPSINHYLTSKRGRLETIRGMEELERLTDELAEKMARGLLGREDIVGEFCRVCRRLRRG